MPLHVKSNSEFKRVQKAHAKVNGEWKSCKVWTKIDGVWTLIHTPNVDATGGNTGFWTVGDITYKYHEFVSSGTFEVNSIPDDVLCDIFVVGAGGGGGGNLGDGGSGGARLIWQNVPLSLGSFVVTVGSGGSGGNGSFPGSSGSSGGSSSIVMGSTYSRDGGAGGAAYTRDYQNSSNGSQFSFYKANTYYGSRGGDGSNSSTQYVGGSNAGNGGSNSHNSTSGVNGTGSGGGGGGAESQPSGRRNGSSGGSGLVVIRYPWTE